MNWLQAVMDAKKVGAVYPGDQPQKGTTMTEKYTPDEAELIGCYAGAMEEQAGENYDQAKADAERGIAKIKADALREAAEREFPLSSHISFTGIAIRERLQFRADRIEEEA